MKRLFVQNLSVKLSIQIRCIIVRNLVTRIKITVCNIRLYFSQLLSFPLIHKLILGEISNIALRIKKKLQNNSPSFRISSILFIIYHFLNTLYNVYQQRVKNMILFFEIPSKRQISPLSLNPINRCSEYNFYQAHR